MDSLSSTNKEKSLKETLSKWFTGARIKAKNWWNQPHWFNNVKAKKGNKKQILYTENALIINSDEQDEKVLFSLSTIPIVADTNFSSKPRFSSTQEELEELEELDNIVGIDDDDYTDQVSEDNNFEYEYNDSGSYDDSFKVRDINLNEYNNDDYVEFSESEEYEKSYPKKNISPLTKLMKTGFEPHLDSDTEEEDSGDDI